MNWSNIKSIFIIAFLFLNSFLGYQLWEKQTKKIEEVEIYESRLDDLFSTKQIINEAELSVYEPVIAQLVAQDASYIKNELSTLEGQAIVLQDGELVATLHTAYPLSPSAEESEVYSFLEKFVLEGLQYRLEAHSDQRIELLQMLDGFPVFESTLVLELDEERHIVGYRQEFYHVEERTEQQVISSVAAVRTLLDKEVFPTNSIIKDASLGYYGQQYELERQLFTPVWRVMVEDQGNILVIYVNAITGALREIYYKEDPY